jgi:DNA polymerase-3 subunit gamma/tau
LFKTSLFAILSIMKASSKDNREGHIALYRKYRPQDFGQVIGQDHIVQALGSALADGKVGHAYLLSGPRGTGKTTIARIMARELGSSPSDVYELDAASNRKIEDAREIRDNLQTLPFDSKYKVYILDEVHMFTKEAWNALLKTIEEPPAHVIFILATTDIEKVPETIVSRCQCFVLKKPTDAVLSDVVKAVAKKEGYKILEGGAELIALLGDGSFRDTLSTLDKVMSFVKEKEITRDDIANISGAPKEKLVEDFLSALAMKDIEKGYKTITDAHEQSIDMEVYLKMIISLMRYALMLRYAPNTKPELVKKLTEHDMEFLSGLIEGKPEAISTRSLSILLSAFQSMRYAFISSIPLELALVEILETPINNSVK